MEGYRDLIMSKINHSSSDVYNVSLNDRTTLKELCKKIGYEPSYDIKNGLSITMDCYISNIGQE